MFGFIGSLIGTLLKTILFKTPRYNKSPIGPASNNSSSIDQIKGLLSTRNEIPEINIGDSEWPHYLSLDKPNYTVTMNSNTPDYDSIFNQKMKFKIENNLLFFKTIEDCVDNYGKITFHIKDGVVLETDLIKEAESSFMRSMKMDRIEGYKKAILWQEVKDWKIKYFIFSNFTELFQKSDLRHLIRSDLERVKVGFYAVEKEAKKLGVEVSMEPAFEKSHFRIPDHLSDNQVKDIQNFFNSESMKKFNVDPNEVFYFKKLETELNSLLSKAS